MRVAWQGWQEGVKIGSLNREAIEAACGTSLGVESARISPVPKSVPPTRSAPSGRKAGDRFDGTGRCPRPATSR